MDPIQMRKEVEHLIRDLGGPSDPALITRHPKAFKRGTVLVRAPINDCLQRAVERVEGKIHAAAEAEKRDKQKEEEEQLRQQRLLEAQQQQMNNNASKREEIKQPAAGSSLHPDLINAISPKHRSASQASNNNRNQSPKGKKMTRAQSAEAAHSARRSQASMMSQQRNNNSAARGAVLSFKSNARLFLGKAFPCGAVDSPGPIYEQKGFGIDTSNGRSFGRARKETPETTTNNSGPTYTGIPAIGKQFLSVRENPTNVVFSKSGRFGEVKENERLKNRGKKIASPGPGAYLSDLDHLPHHRGKAFSPAPSLGVRHSLHTFISREHFAEYQGRSSPGPLYDVSGLQRGTFAPNRTPTFGKGERTPLAKTDKVPGPGTYSPDTKETVIQGPSVGFAKSRRSLKDSNDSPGPIYTPSYEFSEKGQHVVKIGNGPDEDFEKERFSTKLHLGKKLGVDAVGRNSPGPMYNPARKWDGPQYTIQFKEPHVRPSLFPRPDRARWISEQSAKENLGAWSPGPKYDTRGDITKEGGISYSFGSSATDRGEPKKQQTSGANNNSKSVIGASITGNDTSKASANNSKSGENTVPFYDPNITALSTTKPIHSVIISPITKRKSPGHGENTTTGHGATTTTTSGRRSSPSGKQNGDDDDSPRGPPLYNPSSDVRYRTAPSFTFGKGDRSSSIWQTNQDKGQQKGSSTVTGSGMLNINYHQVENGMHAPRLGGLSGY